MLYTITEALTEVIAPGFGICAGFLAAVELIGFASDCAITALLKEPPRYYVEKLDSNHCVQDRWKGYTVEGFARPHDAKRVAARLNRLNRSTLKWTAPAITSTIKSTKAPNTTRVASSWRTPVTSATLKKCADTEPTCLPTPTIGTMNP